MNTLFILLFFVVTPSAYGKNLILMSLGEQKKIFSPQSESITLSRSRIVKIEDHEDFVILKARKEGELFLERKNKTYVIKVLNKNKKLHWKKWIQHVEDIPWVSWNYSNQLNLHGTFYRFKDWKKISDLSQKYQISYRSYVSASPQVKKEALSYFNQHASYFKIEWNQPVLVKTPSFSSSNIFSFFGIQNKQSKTFPFLIDIQLIVIEDRSNKLEFFQKNSMMNILNSPLESIKLSLQKFQNRGESKTLFQTHLLIENNKTGKFFFGGEVPSYSYNKETLESRVQWKPYGLSLEIKPSISTQNNIDLLLTASLSDIDPSFSATDTPATKNHRVSTSIALKNGQTLLLSELQRDQTGNSKKTPFQFSLPLWTSSLMQKGEHKEKTKAFILINAQIKENKNEFTKRI